MRSAPPPRRDQIVLIVFMAAALVVLLAMRERCSKGADLWFKAFDAPAQR